MKKTTVFLILLILAILSGCETTDPLLSADNALQTGSYRNAITAYEAAMNTGKLTPEQRTRAAQGIRKAQEAIAKSHLRGLAPYLDGAITIEKLEEAIAYIEPKLVEDDEIGTIRTEVDKLKRQLTTSRDKLAEILTSARLQARARDWTEAFRTLETARPLTSRQGVINDTFAEVREQRDTLLLKAFRDALGRSELDEARQAYEVILGQDPAFALESPGRLFSEWDNLREDLIPAQIDALLANERYYEAIQKLKEARRESTLRRFASVAKDGAAFYYNIANNARRAMPQEWGVAYFGALAAYELDPASPEYFDLRRTASDQIDERVNVSVGIARFESPINEPDSGSGFSSSLTSKLKDVMPYGVRIIDHTVISRERDAKSTSWRFFVNQRKLEVLVSGNVSRLEVEEKVTRLPETRINRRSVEVDNPNYANQIASYRSNFGTDMSKWPDRPRQRITEIREDEVTLDVHHETIDGVMRVNVRLTLAENDAVEEAKEFEETTSFNDKYHGANTSLGISADLRELPSRHQVIGTMRNNLVDKVADIVAARYADRSRDFYAAYQQSIQRRQYAIALRDLASAHLFLTKENERETREALSSLATAYYREALVDRHDALSAFNFKTGAPANPTTPAPNAPVTRPGIKHYALIIGISDYQDENIPDLNYADVDAMNLYNWLVDPNAGKFDPETIKILRNQEATTTEIRKAVNDWLSKAMPQDFVTIYFAGHGSPHSPERPDDLFFLTYDTDFNSVSSTAYPMKEFSTSLEKYVKAKRVMVITDACHSGGVGSDFSRIERDTARALKPRLSANTLAESLAAFSVEDSEKMELAGNIITPSKVLISSAAEHQTSQEGPKWGGGMGAFTYTLLNGLNGSADYDKNRQISLGELVTFLSTEVARETDSAQTPTVAGSYDPSLTIATY